MLGWLRMKTYRAAVAVDFYKVYGIDIIALSEASVGPTMTKLIVEKVYRDLPPLMTLLGGEQIARILEQANGVKVNAIISEAQLQLMLDGKWDREFTQVPYADPTVG